MLFLIPQILLPPVQNPISTQRYPTLRAAALYKRIRYRAKTLCLQSFFLYLYTSHRRSFELFLFSTWRHVLWQIQNRQRVSCSLRYHRWPEGSMSPIWPSLNDGKAYLSWQIMFRLFSLPNNAKVYPFLWTCRDKCQLAITAHLFGEIELTISISCVHLN